MKEKRILLITLYVVIAGSSVGLFLNSGESLLTYIAGAMLGIAVAGIVVWGRRPDLG